MVTMTKKDEKALKKSPGTTRWASYGYLCYISWFAKRAVHVLTNCYQPIAADESGTIKHWFTDKGERSRGKFQGLQRSNTTTYTWGLLTCMTSIEAT